MKRTLTWIRHGQSTWNAIGRWQGHTDVELSELGRQQSQALAARLKAFDFDAIHASDLSRARTTGELALPERDITVDPRLREINFGVYEGKTSEELTEEERADVYGWWAEPYSRKLKGGESMECLNSRIQSWFDDLPQECNIAVFTHGGVIRNALWQIVGRPGDGQWRASVDNTSLSVIEYTKSVQVVKRFNDHAHLDGLE